MIARIGRLHGRSNTCTLGPYSFEDNLMNICPPPHALFFEGGGRGAVGGRVGVLPREGCGGWAEGEGERGVGQGPRCGVGICGGGMRGGCGGGGSGGVEEVGGGWGGGAGRGGGGGGGAGRGAEREEGSGKGGWMGVGGAGGWRK